MPSDSSPTECRMRSYWDWWGRCLSFNLFIYENMNT
jgi:hypothetical protein